MQTSAGPEGLAPGREHLGVRHQRPQEVPDGLEAEVRQDLQLQPHGAEGRCGECGGGGVISFIIESHVERVFVLGLRPLGFHADEAASKF